MRGRPEPQVSMLAFVDLESRVPLDHPLRTVKRFVDSRPKYSDAREPDLAWYRQVLRADWASPAEVRRDIGSASILKDGRVVFNIGGNKDRIVVWINYPYRIVYVRFIGTHGEYDRIDAQTV